MNAEVIAHLAYGAFRALMGASWRQGPADRVFIQRYADDGLFPFDTEARALSDRLSGCLGCGACETVDASPRALLVHARGLVDLDLADGLVDQVARLDASRLEQLEQSCPASIPFSRMVEMYRGFRQDA